MVASKKYKFSISNEPFPRNNNNTTAITAFRQNDKKFVRHQIIIKFNSLLYIVRYRSDYTPKWRKKRSKFTVCVCVCLCRETVHMAGRILKMQEEVDNNNDDQVLREILRLVN